MAAQDLVELSDLVIPPPVKTALRAAVDAAKASGLQFAGDFEKHHVTPRKAVEQSVFIKDVHGIANYEACSCFSRAGSDRSSSRH
jgi:hypothetical protein